MEEFNIGYNLSGVVINRAANVTHAVIDFSLLFKNEDPINITIIMRHMMQVGRWDVSRDYMIKGVMYEVPAGEGDFRVEKFSALKDSSGKEHPAVLFTFHAVDPADGVKYTTEVLVRHDLVKQFLEKTIESVPRSMESMSYDIDNLVRRILEHDQDGSADPGRGQE